MRAVKCAVVLPALLCSIEGMLWYWDLHSQRTVPSFFGGVSPAVTISFGLDFPATLLSFLTSPLLEAFVRHQSIDGTPEARLTFLLYVAGSWWLIGNWLDHRVAGEDQWKPESVIWFLVLGFGLFAFLFSFHVRVYCFAQTMERALLQTWGVFLIGLPVLAITHRYLEHGRHEHSTEPERRTPVSNFRMFIVVMGAFAVLLIFGVLAGPFIPK